MWNVFKEQDNQKSQKDADIEIMVIILPNIMRHMSRDCQSLDPTAKKV